CCVELIYKCKNYLLSLLSCFDQIYIYCGFIIFYRVIKQPKNSDITISLIMTNLLPYIQKIELLERCSNSCRYC
ncbi:hypothetical protein Goshw_003126, partial [Gossypium schwendimanii]|nr:hypothetical protein [Gossypium schwendimanii]